MAGTGLFGGTFNPIHIAHLRLAEAAREQFGLKCVIFIPARIPPHKQYTEEIPDAERVVILQQAIRGNPAFLLDDLELQRDGLSYSIDTILDMERRYPGDRLFFILGEDHLEGLEGWMYFERLKEKVTFLVAPRTTQSAALKEAVHNLNCRCMVIEAEPLHIASSAIRRKIKTGRSIRYLVPEVVREYIQEKGFYS